MGALTLQLQPMHQWRIIELWSEYAHTYLILESLLWPSILDYSKSSRKQKKQKKTKALPKTMTKPLRKKQKNKQKPKFSNTMGCLSGPGRLYYGGNLAVGEKCSDVHDDS